MLKNLRAKKDGVGIPAFREARVNLSEIIEQIKAIRLFQ